MKKDIPVKFKNSSDSKLMSTLSIINATLKIACIFLVVVVLIGIVLCVLTYVNYGVEFGLQIAAIYFLFLLGLSAIFVAPMIFLYKERKYILREISARGDKFEFKDDYEEKLKKSTRRTVIILVCIIASVCTIVLLYAASATDSGDNDSSSIPSFTNKFGTETTECAHDGCTYKIANSGDTNCCSIHSNKCGECGCYIDEDALFCMSCIRDAMN